MFHLLSNQLEFLKIHLLIFENSIELHLSVSLQGNFVGSIIIMTPWVLILQCQFLYFKMLQLL